MHEKCILKSLWFEAKKEMRKVQNIKIELEKENSKTVQ